MKETNNKKHIGDLGESISCKFLATKGFKVLSRNYRKFFGEIDIIATKEGKTFFFEVKTVSRDLGGNFSHEKLEVAYRAEDNLHPAKLKKLLKTVNYYLLEHKIMGEWQLDAITVLLDTKNKKVKVERIENIVL